MRRVLLAGATAGVLLVLVAPSAVQASQSGPGWSASWRYTSPTELTMRMARPGAALSSDATDNAGTRAGFIKVEDTSSTDGRCAVARIQEVDDTFTTVGSRTVRACDRTVAVPFSSPHQLDIYLCDHIPVGVDGTCTAMTVENTGPDPTLRTAGTGVRWGYLPFDGARHRFTFSLQRPGVRLFGAGQRRDGSWTANATLDTSTNPDPFCGVGQFNSSDGSDLSVRTCEQTSTPLGTLTTSVQFTARACQVIGVLRRCLYGTIA